MNRFDFGSLECEPSGMDEYYRLAVNAEGKANFLMYAVPSDLQTPAYAVATLSRFNGPELAALRAEVRVGRERTYLEAAVPRRVYTTAAALTNLHIAGREVLLAQLDVVRSAVETDITAGSRSVLQVGIVPGRYVRPLPQDIPPSMEFNGAEDFATFTTPDGLFVMGPDGLEIDRYGSAGVRGAEASRRLEILERWAGLAVSGEAALDIIEQSRAEVLAA